MGGESGGGGGGGALPVEGVRSQLAVASACVAGPYRRDDVDCAATLLARSSLFLCLARFLRLSAVESLPPPPPLSLRH